MNMLKSIAAGDKPFAFLTDKTLRRRCQTAFDKGVDCILKTQYRQNGILTVWCAQYDENTLLPAKARAYELPSLSGSESVGIVRLLMNIKNPSKQVQDAIKAALAWFEKNSITGIKIETYTNADGKRDRRAVNDPTAPPLWARFYELDTNRPFFCDRDGIPKYSLAEIGYERRNGYSWYTNAPSVLLK
jgi:pectinesterase